MATTDVEQWTLAQIGGKLVELGNDVHGLKTDMMCIGDRIDGVVADLKAIKTHLGVPDNGS
ncbi:MAG: hypothetical protein F4Z00_07195 [Acidimicrobiaceae bacterium]|nr:hypothetical protein [Acidimicrobiaceae bacterium]MDE0515525.1 hypothetical protein [Acidimicrobiaceae bacterium]MXW94344.1 hypothetical protein [Acidimicrobiaceae bacterium]MXZ65323.1 hypothetical protein [Acidimicrobiaceae bacterium]MXZ98689.1 hypothetical protein [Acidimicrobiaceae bacterium]